MDPEIVDLTADEGGAGSDEGGGGPGAGDEASSCRVGANIDQDVITLDDSIIHPNLPIIPPQPTRRVLPGEIVDVTDDDSEDDGVIDQEAAIAAGLAGLNQMINYRNSRRNGRPDVRRSCLNRRSGLARQMPAHLIPLNIHPVAEVVRVRRPITIDAILPKTTISNCTTEQTTRPQRSPSPPNALKCPICIETYVNVKKRGLKIVVTRCGHIFCDFCLKKAISDNGRKCPKCRKNVPKGPTGIIEIFDVA